MTVEEWLRWLLGPTELVEGNTVRFVGSRRPQNPTTLVVVSIKDESDPGAVPGASTMRQECEEQLRAMDEPIANLKAMVNRMMEQLTPREREVLNQRFGNSKSLPLV